MEVSIENVKEISMVTNYVMMGYDPNAYTDLLRISKGWISYRRTNFHSGNIVCDWSYRTDSTDFLEKYDNLICTFYHELNCPSDKVECTDCGSFNIRITFNNGKVVNIPGTSSLYKFGLGNQATAMFELIPHGEECPDFIKPFVSNFYEEGLSKKNLFEIDPNDVICFMYAEGGAMGMPGHTEIITNDFVRFSNYLDSDLSQIEALDFIPGFNHESRRNHMPVEKVEFCDTVWMYIDLGMGNHLYMKPELYNEIGNQIIDVLEYKRYRNWCRIFAFKEE